MAAYDFAPVSEVRRRDLPREMKERAVINNRREVEKARRARILNVKNRTIGLDVPALNAQVKTKADMHTLEKRRQDALDQAMIASTQQADILQLEVNRIKASQERELREYRAKFQGRQSRREYDLSDPNTVRNDTNPIEHPEKLGLGSAQLFTGMDMTAEERKLVQAEQMRAWCAEHIEAKEAAEARERDATLKYEHAQNHIAASLDGIISMHNSSKKNVVLSTAAENKALADAKREHTEREKAATEAQNVAEINTAMDSAFLTEDPATTVSAINPNRPVPYHFKGLPVEYKQHILDVQMHQARDQQESKMADKANDAAWEQYTLSANREAVLMERHIERQRSQQRRELAETHRSQAAERRSRRPPSARADPAPEFFAQFGTSSR